MKTQTQTVPNRRYSIFYYLPIYHLIIITIPDLEFIAVPIHYLLIMAIHDSAFLEYKIT